jgi:predicted NBD/HSP70 family sugar kinase
MIMKNIGNIIGVDLGGTNIRAGKIVEQTIIQTTDASTPSSGTEGEGLTNLKIVVSEVDHSAFYGAAAMYLNSKQF